MLKDLRFADYFYSPSIPWRPLKNVLLSSKRYLEGLRWESILDESIKERLEIGNSFHLLAYRYFWALSQD